MCHQKKKASGKPAAKARPILKPSSTSGWDLITIRQRSWIDIETEESNDPYCFQVSKFITRFLRQSKVHREVDGAVHYDQVIDECKRKSYRKLDIGQTRWKRNSSMSPHWSIDKWISVLAKEKRKGFNIAWIQTFLTNCCTLEQFKDILEVLLILHCKTLYCYQKVYRVHVSRRNGKELRSIVNNGLIPGGTSLKRDRQAVFFTIVNPMDNQDGFGETLCDLSQARVAPYKNTWKRFQKTIFLVQFEARSTERTAILSNKVKLSFTLRHTACRVHRESDMHQDLGSALSGRKRGF